MEIVRQVLSILFVFALLGGVLWAVRRKTGLWPPSGRQAKSLHSIERLALSPQHALHIVHIEGRRLVVATHPQGCTLLTELNNGVPK